MDKKDVTIVVPIYNVEKYLKRCLDSIINQTYEDVDIILVNDGSTDNSLDICYEYKKKDNRITVINQENQGLSAARNAGIEMANSNYIMFIDSDDYIELDMVEYLIERAKKYDSDIACCGFTNIYENGIKEKITKPQNDVVYSKEEALDLHLFSGYIDVVAWNKLYKLELFDDIRYPIGKLYEDMLTTYLLIEKSEIISLHPDSKYYYCKRNSSIGGNPYSKKTKALSYACNCVMKYITEKYPQIRNIKVANIQWNMVVLNKMILSNQIDKAFLKDIRILIRNSFLSVLKCKYIDIKRKFQIIILVLSINIYKYFYKNYLRKNR